MNGTNVLQARIAYFNPPRSENNPEMNEDLLSALCRISWACQNLLYDSRYLSNEDFYEKLIETYPHMRHDGELKEKIKKTLMMHSIPNRPWQYFFLEILIRMMCDSVPSKAMVISGCAFLLAAI